MVVKKFFSLLVIALLAIPMVASAHGPTRQKITETVKIAAPPPAVWQKVGTFGDMHSWHPAVAETVAEGGNEPGAMRVLRLKGGGEIEERLERYDDEGMSLFYRITKVDVKVLPVTDYSSWLSVAPGDDGGAVVQWRGAFYRGDPGNTPPPELNNEAAVEAVGGIYTSGLDNLKALMEGSN
jgi:hypothetical protein